jgi:hypothetical protein
VADLTVAAVPFYFGSMEAERRWLRARAAANGPSPVDYERSDTLASLAMGVASLVAPFGADAVIRRLAPGTGRFPNLLVRTALAAAALTTAADRLAAWGDEHQPPRRRRIGRFARRVAKVGGPTAIASGTLALSTAVRQRTSGKKLWPRNGGRDLGGGPTAWAAAVVGWDLIYYWNHRLMHEVRGMWAVHVVHHSSQRYNLSTALRQPVADVLGVFVPYGSLALLGVRPRLIEQARGINLLYQYWIHTDAIRRLGAAEEVLNTPSHHRVHHGANSKYIDRNHGSILIVWDRLFGTFQREEEPVIYGLTKNIGTYDPRRIASHEYADIVRDVAGSTNWHDRLSFVLRGPGWAYERHAQQALGVGAGAGAGAAGIS